MDSAFSGVFEAMAAADAADERWLARMGCGAGSVVVERRVAHPHDPDGPLRWGTVVRSPVGIEHLIYDDGTRRTLPRNWGEYRPSLDELIQYVHNPGPDGRAAIRAHRPGTETRHLAAVAASAVRVVYD